MKKLLALVVLLAPFTAHAASSITCNSTGTGGPLTLTITSEALDKGATAVKVDAQGILHTTVDGVVGAIVQDDESVLVVQVTNLGFDGAPITVPGEAILSLALRKEADGTRTALGNGGIAITKPLPRHGALRMESVYPLDSCRGSI